MPQLAISGGAPIRTEESWPGWPIHDEREEELILEVTRSGIWSFEGPKEAEFCERFAEFNSARYCLLVANGTIALQLALEALEVGPGDEVLVPGLTWQATAAACVDVNATPVLVDVDPATYCIDVGKARDAITARTRAIIPVHLCGGMADMDAIADLAREHDLVVIEDCAQAHGSQWRGKCVGTLGEIGCFSMQQRKVLTSGEGGAVITDDERLFQRLYSLKNCGRSHQPTGGEQVQSGNYRITEFQAAILLAQLERLESQVILMDENAQYLDEALGAIAGISPMMRYDQITRRCHYVYLFRYDEEGFGGLPLWRFGEAFAAELGIPLTGLQGSAMNNDPLYRPHTKKRHHWSEDYRRAIDPTRCSLPVCEGPKNVAGIFHNYMLGTRADMDDIVSAVAKIRDNQAELAGE